MNYNWADPKKNSKLSSLMMSKAEASRKKRLTSVRSTLSNQLHPTLEHKLRKKKKAPPVSARRESQDKEERDDVADNYHVDNNDDHKHLAQKAVDSPSRQPEPDSDTSTFDAFNMNAAAGGLFHPESTISAFIEHDVKYFAGSLEKKTSAQADASGPGVRELPTLSSRGSASSLRLLHTRGSSRSSSASSFASSGSSSRESTATRSDSDLLMLAPRRLDAVPSSADRTTHDFFEDDHDDSDHEELQQTTPPDPAEDVVNVLDLASKFAALKQMFHTNHANGIASGRSNNPELQEENGRGSKPTKSENGRVLESGKARLDPSSRASGKSSASAKAISASTISGPEKVKAPAVVRRESKAEPKKTSSVHREPTKSLDEDIMDVLEKKSKKKESKAHIGMSLTDLKEEHRAALELLKELGGSKDTEFRDDDMDRSIRALAARSGKSHVFGMHGTSSTTGRSTGSVVGRGTHSMAAKVVGKNSPANKPDLGNVPEELTSAELSPRCKDDEHSSPNRPLTSSSSSTASLVMKLRSSIALGREIVPNEDTVDEDTVDEDPMDEGPLSCADASSQPSDFLRYSENESKAAAPTSESSEPAVGEQEVPWRQYCATFEDMDEEEDDDDDQDARDGDKRDQHVGGIATPITARSTDNRYSDEGFEADW